jgi:hypothetical protein
MLRGFSVGGSIVKESLNIQAMVSMSSALDDVVPRYCLTGFLSRRGLQRFGWLSSSRRGKVSDRSCCQKEGLANNMTEMALFHDSFVALKARCPFTLACDPDDYILGGERKLFQEYVRARLPTGLHSNQEQAYLR